VNQSPEKISMQWFGFFPVEVWGHVNHVAKAKQKNVPAEPQVYDNKVKAQQTAYLNQCVVNDTYNKKRLPIVWWILVLNYAGLKFSKFFRAKNKMVEPAAEFLYKLVQTGDGPAILRIDNAGENIKLHKWMQSADWKLPIQVQYTAYNTPQQYSPAETSFTTISGRVHATFHMVLAMHRQLLFPYAASQVTDMDGLSVVSNNGITATRYKHQLGFEPGWTKYLHMWGQAGTVCLKQTKHPKLDNKGATMMFVGYASDHPPDTFNMWDPKTQWTHKTHDVIWQILA
jgi:hypothetical protein